jgi:hypothetical protein
MPTLSAPFDFIDDGNLVYPAPPGISPREHMSLWWKSVVANVDHLGPFRPTLWAHWHLQANLFGPDPMAWRVYRLAWCALAAGMLLWLLRELGISAPASLFAAAAAIWNPYRSEIWTSLTLSEGVAMPYALFALVAARKAAASNRAWLWDGAGVISALIALGCKNTFAAVVPAQVALRLCAEGLPIRDCLRRHGLRASALSMTLALPVAHFVYFKLNWHPGQYDPPGPTLAQFGRLLSALKGGIGLDFLGAGLVVGIVAVAGRLREFGKTRAALICGALLATGGVAVYLPLDAVSGRYTMPAVWGLDIAFALLAARVLKSPASWARVVAVVLLSLGLAALLVANVQRQEKVAARSRMLWEVARHIERVAPPGTTVAWISGDPARGGLGAEEGIHLQWHLANRGRADVRIALYDSDEQTLPRVELRPTESEPVLRVAGSGPGLQSWERYCSFSVMYQFGRKQYDCHISRPGSATQADTRGSARPAPPPSP